MSDRTEQIREVVARYEGFEFIPVRMQDAFDRGWWERVSGGAASSLTNVPQAFDLTGGGSCDGFSDSVVQLTDLPFPHQTPDRSLLCVLISSPCPLPRPL